MGREVEMYLVVVSTADIEIARMEVVADNAKDAAFLAIERHGSNGQRISVYRMGEEERGTVYLMVKYWMPSGSSEWRFEIDI